MPAKKAARKGAKRGNRKGAKKPGSKGSIQMMALPCPDIPKDFFKEVAEWSATMKKWAKEVDKCYKTTCGSQDRRDALLALCADFSTWAHQAKYWADDVEDCYQDKCVPLGDPPGHTKPPPPPF